MNTAEYLKSEIARIERKAHTAKLIGVVLTVIVLSYAIIGIWYVNVLTQPQSLANFVIARFGEEAPKVVNATELKLIENAPDVANNLSKCAQQAIPEFRMRAQTYINKILEQKFTEVEKTLEQMTDAYFCAHQDKFKPRQPRETVEAFGKRIANALADQFGESLNEDLKANIGKDVYTLNSETRYIIQRLKTHLDTLSKSDFSNLSRADQIESILLAHLINKYLHTIPQP